MPTTTATAPEVKNGLTALDRCDGCNAPAIWVAVKDDLTLLFCNHDKHKHETALQEQGFDLIQAGEIPA